MGDLLFKLFVFLISWVGIRHMILQIRRIIIPSRLTGIVGKRFLQGLIVIVFLFLGLILKLNPLEWVVILSPGVFLYLSIYNKGFTSNGIIPYMSGGVAWSSISNEFLFEETKDWLIMEEPKRLKVRFTTVKRTGTVLYTYFHLEDKEKIKELLHKNNQSFDITKGKQM